VAQTVDKGHGRTETRKLETTTILTMHQKWPGLKQGFRITRTRVVKGVATTETVYGITSLAEQEADAKLLLELVRGHWEIENGLHWVRDVTMGEDKCRVRRGNAPQALAALRNAALHLLAGSPGAKDAKSRAEIIRHLGSDISRPLQLLGFPQLET
jgi:predicted transposase YbfD/YdcC